MADVFVSYARSDKARVAPLVAAIEAQGWSVWWDRKSTPARSLTASSRRNSGRRRRPGGLDAGFGDVALGARRGARGADRGILVPVRFEGASLPIDARALHTTDLDNWGEDPRSPQVQEVLRAVGAIIKRDRGPKPAGASCDPVPSASATEPARIAICVLPFANMSVTATGLFQRRNHRGHHYRALALAPPCGAVSLGLFPVSWRCSGHEAGRA